MFGVLLCSVVLSIAFAGEPTPAGRAATIRPDYSDMTIPPNIAPMNFMVEEDATAYRVKVYSDTDSSGFEVSSKTGSIQMSQRKWAKLITGAKGSNIYFDISAKTKDGNWQKFDTITNTVANEEIDGYLAYRFMKPIYNWWRSIEIRQRDLTSFDDSSIMHGKSFGEGCINCHTFNNNEPDRMTIGIRGKLGVGTILAIDGDVHKVGAKWGYTEWHPSGKLAVYSVNKVRQFFHSVGMEMRDVVDLDSAIAYYDVEKKEVRTADALSDIDRLETYPAWTPDGKTLYFCSAPILWEDRDTVPPARYAEVQYDLCKVSYDIETDTWGDAETVLTAEETGKSILIPKISPDGNFLVFCMSNYGCFPIYQQSSDLYIMDLRTGKWSKMGQGVNSEYSESWHSWSCNSRWLAFSSKRRGGLFTRTFFCYIDKDGKVSKPFILPQKDPEFYDSLLQTYSLPQLVKSKVKYSERALARAAKATEQIEVKMPLTGATPKTKTQSWEQIRE